MSNESSGRIMVTMEDLLDVLVRLDRQATMHVENDGDKPDSIVGVSSLVEPIGNTMTWASAERAIAANREVSKRVVFLPSSVPMTVSEKFPCHVLTADPKATLFALAVHFFPNIAKTNWRSLTAEELAAWPGIHPSVMIGGVVTVGSGVTVGPNTCLAHCDVGNDVAIGCGCVIGGTGFGYSRSNPHDAWVRVPHFGRVRLCERVEIGSCTCIDRGTLGSTWIGARTKVDNLVHIAHNVMIESDCMVIAHAMLGGSCRIGESAWIAPSVAIMNQARVGERVTAGLGAVILKDVAAGATVVGNPARAIR